MKKTTFFKSILLALAIMVGSVSAWGQTYYAMSSGDYSQTFTAWSGYATNWNGLAILGTGTIPVATKTTIATTSLAVISSSTAIGYDAASSTKLVFLTTGTTDNSAAIACDLNLNFTGRNAGNLSFDAAEINNSTGNRVSTLRVYYSTDGSAWSELTGTNLPFIATNNVTNAASISISLPAALNNQSTVKLRFYSHNGSGGTTGSRPKISLDNVTVTSTSGSATPTLTVSPSTLTGFTYSGSGPSAEQSFTAGGTNLTNNITLTAPTDFEISTGTGGSFIATSPITLTQTGGTVATTTIYARLKAGLAVGSYNSENIAVASTGATAQNVTCNGSVTAITPTITVTEATVAAFSANIGSAPTKTINVSGANLTGNITLALSGTNADQFSLSQTSLTQTGGSVSNTVITITYTPTTTGPHTATLTLSSTGATDVTRSLSGTAGLATPVAAESSANNNSGFTANWSAVPGSTDYVLSVYTKTGGGTPTPVLSENFDLFSAGATGAGASSSPDNALTSMDALTQTAGWTGAKVYSAGGTIKLGTGTVLGSITTPSIDLSASGGAFNVSFKSMAWSTDSTKVKIYLNDVLVKTVTGLTNDVNYTLNPFSVDLTGGTAASKIKFEGLQAAKGRFFLEDLVISSGSGSTLTPVSGSPFTVTGTNSYVLTGLQGGSTYYYTVVAKNATVTTASSNEIIASTMATGLSTTQNSLSVSASDGIIRFTAESGQVMELYNAVGQKLLIKTTTAGLNSIPVAAKGFVVVKVGNQIAKVVL